MNDTAPAPKKPNLLLRLLALLVTAALVLGALLLVVYRDRFNLDALKRWMSYRTLQTSDTGEAVPFTHAGGEKFSAAYLEDGILIASTAGSHYYSFSGEDYAEDIQSMENPVLSACAKAGVVYDAGGETLALFRTAQETFQLKLDSGSLFSARTNNSGWLAVTAQQSGYKGAVTVYNAAGKEVIQILLSSTFAVDAAVSPDCKTVAVVTIGQENGSFTSKILFYPVNKKEPRTETSLGNTAVLDLDYESGALWVVGENRLSIVSDDDGSVQTYSFERSYLKGCALGGDGFALLLLGRYRAGSASRALVIGSDGTELAELPLSSQVLDFDAAGDYCSLLTGSALTIYTKDLAQYAQLDSVQGARTTALSADGSALLADDQQAWLFIPS